MSESLNLILSKFLELCLKVGIHSLMIATCYIPMNNDNHSDQIYWGEKIKGKAKKEESLKEFHNDKNNNNTAL